MSLFSERDPNEITTDTLHLLKESMDFRAPGISTKAKVDRLLNRVYYWWLNNVDEIEGYSVGVYNICSPPPGHNYWGSEYYSNNSYGWCPELQEFLDEMRARGFQCNVDTLNNRIHFTW